MTAWLLLTLVLLALVVWMGAHVITIAHRAAGIVSGRRHGSDSPPHTHWSDADPGEEPSGAAFPQSAAHDLCSAPDRSTVPSTPVPQVNAAKAAAASDAYADPIDGVPFLPGEHAVACLCGLAYRADSLDWLRIHYDGKCVQCGTLLPARQGSPVA